MSLEAIKVVAAAETESDKQRLEALAEAKRIIAAAEAKGKEDLQSARGSAEAQAQALCRDAEAQAKESADKATEVTRGKCRSLADEATGRMDRAVALIVESVVSSR